MRGVRHDTPGKGRRYNDFHIETAGMLVQITGKLQQVHTGNGSPFVSFRSRGGCDIIVKFTDVHVVDKLREGQTATLESRVDDHNVYNTVFLNDGRIL